LTLIELTLETAIKEAGEFLDVRLSKEDAEYVLDLIKKQEKEAKQVIGVHEFIEGMKVGCCPSCNRSIVTMKIDEYRFCPYCGQEVKWK